MIRFSVHKIKVRKSINFSHCIKKLPTNCDQANYNYYKKQIRLKCFGKQNLKIPNFCGFECCDYLAYSLGSND